MNRIRLALASLVALVALVAAGAALAAPQASPQRVSIDVKSDVQHAKKGPDGKWHDAFLPASFSVRAGSRVVVTIHNYDSAPHMFMAPKLGLNVAIAKGSGAHPSVTTFTFTPKKAGSYAWSCMAPCDPWAMSHAGYMRGVVTVA